MIVADKKQLAEKVGNIANQLGYDVGLLSSGADEGEADMAHLLSNAVDQLRLFQRMMLVRVLREEGKENG